MLFSRANMSFSLLSLQQWLRKHEQKTVLVYACVVGIVAGLAAVGLKETVHFLTVLFVQTLPQQGYTVLFYIAPFLGIFIALWLSRRFGMPAAQHGVTQLLYAVSKNSARLPFKNTYGNFLTSGITVGLGGSLGLEAPVVGIGASMGSNLARWTRMPYKLRLTLIGCGIAAAISSIFNSPIAGVVFAVEVVLIEVSVSLFIPVLVASITGALVARTLLGDDQLFSFTLDPTKEVFPLSDTPYYILLGIVCGFVALHFMRMNFYIEAIIAKIKHVWWRGVIGATLLLFVLQFLPALYGEGYITNIALLNNNKREAMGFDPNPDIWATWGGEYFLVFLFLLVIFKPIASGLTLASGGNGGVFAPSLFIGSVGGYLFASIMNLLVPGLALNTSPFMLAGMCGVISSLLHVPLTAIFLIAEITNSYAMFIPLMISATVGYLTLNIFEKYSFYAKHLVEHGKIASPENRDSRVLDSLSILDIVEKDLTCVLPDGTLKVLVDAIRRSKRNIFPVVDEEGVFQGVVSLDDIRDLMFDQENQENLLVKDLMRPSLATIDVENSMQSVMQAFEQTQAWNLPVLENGKYLGFISKSKVFSFYRQNLLLAQDLTKEKK